MNVITFHDIHIVLKEGDPLLDKDGNVIGKVVSWKPEGDRMRVVHQLDDKAMADLITGKGGTFSMGMKPNG